MNTITKEIFEHEMNRGKTFQTLETDRAEYWTGYQRGLRRAYHGETFGTKQEHTLWLAAGDDEDPIRQQPGARIPGRVERAMQAGLLRPE